VSRMLASVITLLFCLVPHLDTQSDCGEDATNQAMRCLLDSGRYGEAERIAIPWIRQLTTQYGRNSLQVADASDYLVEALLEGGKSGDRATLDWAESTLAVKTRLLSRSDRALAVTLDNLGAVHRDRGEFTSAVDLHQRALTLKEQSLPSDPGGLADTLDALGRSLILAERLKEADTVLERSLRIRQTEDGASPSRLARTLSLIAMLRKHDGQYTAGLRLADDALSLQRAISRMHPDLSSTLQIRGDLLFLSGDVAGADQTWTEAFDVAAHTLGAEHPLTLLLMRELAVSAKSFGDFRRARELLERVGPVGRRVLAPCHQEVTYELNDLANLLEYDGDYTRSRTLYNQALSTSERCLGRSHSQTITIIHNQAILALDTGDFAEAERLERQVLMSWSTNLGSNHPYIARVLDVLADIASARGDPMSARTFYERALSIRERAMGRNSPDVAWTFASLADVAIASRQTRLALRDLDEAIDIYSHLPTTEQPHHRARVFALRGRVLVQRGEFESAKSSFEEALSARGRLFGALHPLTASSRADLAAVDFALGATKDALTSALDAERVGRDHLRFTIRYLPERQAMAYAAARPRGLDLALSVVVANSVSATDVFDAVIRSRGVILDELAARAAQATSEAVDSEFTRLNSALVGARLRFANLMLRSLRGEDNVPAITLDDARRQKEDAERALAERSFAADDEAQRAQTGLEDVHRAMPAGSVLVSFIRYDGTALVNRPSGRTITTTPSYIALVAHADSEEVNVIPLGAASSLERLVEAWRAEAGGRAIAAGIAPREADRTYRAAATALRARVWDPIADSLKGASRVFIVPDGALNLVSFAALPVGNRYLLESGLTIHYLSTERDLVRAAGAEGRGLLALGGPAFDTGASATGSAALRSGCGAIGSLRFEDLPGSRAEAQDIARIWGDRNDVLMLSGRAATKAALTKAIVGRRVVHLATHGFFLGSNCDAAGPRTRGVGGIVGGATVQVDNPLLLSGLALAGVNALTGARQSNGILNAEEIAGLNLQGTEWVVLSACDTGLGQITAGEGVFGLRRALQIAGAHTIIMSLWSVEDQSTRDWMKALYTARLTKQLDTPDAVRAASVQVLEQRRKQGLSTHPFYWAAFVAAGDWR
jgi:CHAT domain-containing protein/tetratricopeptide (TPR) repeat protein